MDDFTTLASKCISKISQLESQGAPPITLNYHPPPDYLYVYISRCLARQYMAFYDVVNLVPVTKMNMIDEML